MHCRIRPRIKLTHALLRSMIAFLFIIAAFPCVLTAQAAGVSAKATVQAMEAASGAAIQARYSRTTGLATFIATQPGHPIAASGVSPENVALAFLASYGGAFGIADSSQLRMTRARGPDEVGMHQVRFQQIHNGVPVRAAELTVHLRGTSVVTVQAKTLPAETLVDTNPSLPAQNASISAKNFLLQEFEIPDATLSTPSLEFLNVGLFTGTRTPMRLAWFVEAKQASLPLHEFIWVDAHTGTILHHFSQIHRALTRSIYQSQEPPDGTLVRAENQSPIGDREVDLAYDYAGDTYDYYLKNHGRDSWDNKGGALISVVRYANATFCSVSGAKGGSGTVWWCPNTVADDVAGHEITHSILQSEGVVYAGETVPISEGYAWIFGETIDLTNGRGNDNPEMRWKGGEDVLRNINAGISPVDFLNPTSGGYSGKVSDPQTGCADFQTVYNNFTILTHAYALIVDGGIYNGQTIAGIGLKKAAKIHYRAMTTYLRPATTFLDNYDFVQRSCQDLIGSDGITSGDCLEVKKALDAVEMSLPLCGEFLLTANNQHSIDVRLSRGDGTFDSPVSVGQDLGVNYTEFAIIDNYNFVAATGENPPKLYSFRREPRRNTFTRTLVRTLDADPNPIRDYGLGLTYGVHPAAGTNPSNTVTVPFLTENVNGPFRLPDGTTQYWIDKGNLCLVTTAFRDLNCKGTVYPNAFNFSNIFTGWTLGKSSNMADVDGDGYADMLASEQAQGGRVSSKVYLLRGARDVRQSPIRYFFQAPIHVFTTANQPATFMTLGDFNSDGKVDAIVGQDDDGDAGAAYLFLGRGDGTFAQKGVKAFDTRPDINSGSDQPGGGMFQAYDADHDRILDIISAARLYGPVTSNPETAQLLFFRGRGNGTFEPPKVIEANLLTATAFTNPPTTASALNVKPTQLVNNSFPKDPPLKTNYVATACAPAAQAGTYTISATFRNISPQTLSNLEFVVRTLSGGNMLCNAKGGPGGVGSFLAVPWQGDLADGFLAPKDSVVVEFQIGLASKNKFEFHVDLNGIVE